MRSVCLQGTLPPFCQVLCVCVRMSERVQTYPTSETPGMVFIKLFTNLNKSFRFLYCSHEAGQIPKT